MSTDVRHTLLVHTDPSSSRLCIPTHLPAQGTLIPHPLDACTSTHLPALCTLIPHLPDTSTSTHLPPHGTFSCLALSGCPNSMWGTNDHPLITVEGIGAWKGQQEGPGKDPRSSDSSWPVLFLLH